jgi:hypothetical protein
VPVEAAGREFEHPAATRAMIGTSARKGIRVDGMNVLQGPP